jgi:hypothetical protein
MHVRVTRGKKKGPEKAQDHLLDQAGGGPREAHIT